MKICDRCKKELDTKRKSLLAGESFELCTDCAEHIADHIINYKNKNTNNLLYRLFINK